MKRLLVFLLLSTFALIGLAAEPPAASPAPKTASQQAVADIMAVARQRPVDRPRLLDLYLEFYRKFPDADDREIYRIAGELPKLLREPTPEDAGFVADYRRRLTEAIASPDYGDKARDALMAVDAMIALGKNGPGAPVDLAAARLKLDAFFSRYPRSNNWAQLETEYAKLLGQTDPAAEVAHLKKTAADANPQMAEHIRGLLLVKAAGTTPMEMKFTAADGREVDLSKLRGKVVLIDFWATWCGPCVAELPNVKKVYADYHEKGFEVVGITLENPGANPKDTAEQKSAKLATAKEKMLAFAAENQLPWPQYFDGKWWKNDISSRYSITAIPAMFLLDQEGKVVSTNARGVRLEIEVSRLLKP